MMNASNFHLNLHFYQITARNFDRFETAGDVQPTQKWLPSIKKFPITWWRRDKLKSTCKKFIERMNRNNLRNSLNYSLCVLNELKCTKCKRKLLVNNYIVELLQVFFSHQYNNSSVGPQIFHKLTSSVCVRVCIKVARKEVKERKKERKKQFVQWGRVDASNNSVKLGVFFCPHSLPGAVWCLIYSSQG